MATNSNRPASNRKAIIGLGGAGLAALVACLSLVAAALIGGIYLVRNRQPAGPQPVVAYVLDTSARMQLPAQGSSGATRLSVAESVLAEALRPSEASLTSGLRVFGEGDNTDSCKDTSVVVPFAPANQTQIVTKLSQLAPGTKPDAALSQAMIAAIHDLAQYRGPHWLVVVTGGVDSCEAGANQAIADAAKQSGIELESYVIGYQLDDTEALAVKGYVGSLPNSSYLPAPDGPSLRAIMGAIQNFIEAPSDLMRTAIAQAALPTATRPAPATPTLAPPTATTLPSPTPYPAQTACDNPYWPLRTGAEWKYKDYTQSVVSVSGDTVEAQVVLKSVHATYTNLWNFACDAKGFTIGDYSITFKKNNLKVPGTLVTDSGLWFPAAGQLVAGFSWTDKRAYHHTTPKTVANYFIAEDCSVEGLKPITVTAGTFAESLQIGCSIEDTSTGQDVKSKVQQNYVYGIGQVNDLESYSMP